MNVYSGHRIQPLFAIAAGMFMLGMSHFSEAHAADNQDDTLIADVGDDVEAMESTLEDTDDAPVAPAPRQDSAAPKISLAPSVSFQKKPDTSNHFRSDIDLTFRTQPLALELRLRMYNQHSYMRNNTSILFSDVYLRAGAAINFSPAYVDGGVDVEFQPIRVFNLRASYLVGYNYGAFGYMTSFADPSSIVKDKEWKEMRGHEQSGMRQRIQVVPTFQVALGGLVLMNRFTYQYVHFRGQDFDDDGDWVLASEEDRMVLKDGDHVLDNFLFVGYKIWDPDGAGAAQFLLGPLYEWTRGVGAHKAQEDIRTNYRADYGSDRHRVGLMAAYVPKHRWGKVLAPHILLQGGYNITDSNGRDGNVYVQGALGLSFERKKPE